MAGGINSALSDLLSDSLASMGVKESKAATMGEMRRSSSGKDIALDGLMRTASTGAVDVSVPPPQAQPAGNLSHSLDGLEDILGMGASYPSVPAKASPPAPGADLLGGLDDLVGFGAPAPAASAAPPPPDAGGFMDMLGGMRGHGASSQPSAHSSPNASIDLLSDDVDSSAPSASSPPGPHAFLGLDAAGSMSVPSSDVTAPAPLDDLLGGGNPYVDPVVPTAASPPKEGAPGGEGPGLGFDFGLNQAAGAGVGLGVGMGAGAPSDAAPTPLDDLAQDLADDDMVAADDDGVVAL